MINILLGAGVLGTPIDKRVAAGGTLGFLGIAAMFYPQLAGTTINTGALIGLAFSVAGTFSFCSGNMISAQLQSAASIFATTGYGMIYGALPRPARGRSRQCLQHRLDGALISSAWPTSR